MSISIAPTLSLPQPYPDTTSGKLEHYIDTITVIEHACRRCGKEAAMLTAEQLNTAKSNLHLILSALSNRGVNLWAVDRQALPLARGLSTYTLPLGTEKIVNMVYRTSERIVPSATVFGGLDNCSIILDPIERFKMVGFKLPTAFSGKFVFDWINAEGQWELYHNFGDIELSAGWHWYILDQTLETRGFRIRNADGLQLEVLDMMLCRSTTDVQLAHLNRDQFSAIPRKDSLGKPNSYFFDKQVSPRIVLWPIPQYEDALLVIWRQRRIQDVGALGQKLEIPERWFDAVVWALAKNLAFELPNVTETRITMCVSQADVALKDAELGESDQAPIYIQPNISGYTA